MGNTITGRDDLIIAQALFEAAYLLRNREPAHLRQPANARDMEKILFTQYPGLARAYAFQHLLGRAMDLGYQPVVGEKVSEEVLVEFILSKDPGASFVGDPTDGK
jgi:hypothetical protein